MNEKDLISIVVPIYKVEKYLKKCIDSIINQTYKNIEIILIDDGSPDNCGRICEEYAKKDNRIKVIHKENGGLSDARNKGIDISNGKYITFVDSDDYIDIKYIERLYSAIQESNSEISQCNIAKVNNQGKLIKKIGYKCCKVKSGKEMINDSFLNNGLENTVVWNKMYDIKFFKELRYPIGKIHEDEFITYKILYNVDRIAIVNCELYYYRMREDSIIGKKFNIKTLDRLEAIKEKILYFKDKGDIKLYELSIIQYLYAIEEYYIQVEKNKLKDSQKIKKDLRENYKTYYKIIYKSENIKLKERLKIFIFYINPKIFYYLKSKK